MTPYALGNFNGVITAYAHNSAFESEDFTNISRPNRALDFGTDPTLTYAVWSTAMPSAVPLPAGGLMLLSGLIGTAALRRLKPSKV